MGQKQKQRTSIFTLSCLLVACEQIERLNRSEFHPKFELSYYNNRISLLWHSLMVQDLEILYVAGVHPPIEVQLYNENPAIKYMTFELTEPSYKKMTPV